MTLSRKELEHYLNELLTPKRFQDYGPNGLQIEGTDSIKRIAFAVSATAASAQQAISLGCDTLIVHHGLFWGFHPVKTLTGSFGRRVRPLVQNNINLFGYHLPLDAHPEMGNAATLGQKIGLINQQPFGNYKGMPTGISGQFTSAVTATELKQKLAQLLDHNVLVSTHDSNAKIASMGIITGGANGDWYQAERAGLDAYLTGEMSEHDWHESQEAGVHMFAGGHHATEQFGIQALMAKIQEQFGVKCDFVNSNNPA